MANNTGITGISHPFRLNQKGGIAMSTTSTYDKTHIEEGLRQLFGTNKGERVMERNAGTLLSDYVFDPSDESLYNLIKYEVLQEIADNEPRITVNEDITTVFADEVDDSKIFVELHYTINKYDDGTEFISVIQVQ